MNRGPKSRSLCRRSMHDKRIETRSTGLECSTVCTFHCRTTHMGKPEIVATSAAYKVSQNVHILLHTLPYLRHGILLQDNTDGDGELDRGDPNYDSGEEQHAMAKQSRKVEMVKAYKQAVSRATVLPMTAPTMMIVRQVEPLCSSQIGLELTPFCPAVTEQIDSTNRLGMSQHLQP